MRAVLAPDATLAKDDGGATSIDDAVAARRDAERRAFDAANAQKACDRRDGERQGGTWAC